MEDINIFFIEPYLWFLPVDRQQPPVTIANYGYGVGMKIMLSINNAYE